MTKTRTVTGHSKRPRAVKASTPKLTAREVEFVKALYRDMSDPARMRARFLLALDRNREAKG